MTFTNDDLKRLKEEKYLGATYDETQALLARLACAEAALKELKGDAEETVLYAKWRESCGL